ncbi:hypothetical protein BVRB_7g177130 [Beta vulgaris subsp. vulgaris]|nr:hypothetical protein BVRB_7g177130 [Beta vulgaris subsp. vulgaris]
MGKDKGEQTGNENSKQPSDKDIFDYDDFTNILHPVDDEGGNDDDFAGLEQLEQELVNENQPILSEDSLPTTVTRKSSRQAEVPNRYKDYIYDIPGKHHTPPNETSCCAVVDQMRQTKEFAEEYLSYMNNVLRTHSVLLG